MNREYMGWVVAAVVIAVVCTMGAVQQQGEVGRYQVVFGEHTLVASAEVSADYRHAVRVDTATGQTSLLVMFKGDGYRWVPIGDRAPINSVVPPQ